MRGQDARSIRSAGDMMETDMAGMTEIPEAMKFRTTWTKGAGYRPYVTL